MAWQTEFNRARSIGCESLRETIMALKGKESVTEQVFRSVWLETLNRSPSLIVDGWYSPPPHGITVLTATPDEPSRLSYSSLRSEEYWPSARCIDWRNGLLLAYCSPIDRISGRAGDIAITLYFGTDQRIREFFRRAHHVVADLVDSISIGESPKALLKRAEAAFSANCLINCVTSVTDPASYNIGHTVPLLDPNSLSEQLSEDQRCFCRTQRRFLNYAADWNLTNGIQFTFEPQIRSSVDAQLPQLTFHYLVQIENDKLHVCRDVDVLLREYDLVPL